MNVTTLKRPHRRYGYHGGSVQAGVVSKGERLANCSRPLLIPFDASDDRRGLYAKSFAEAQQKFDCWRLLATFQQADVVARNVRSERKFFLRQASAQSCFS